MSARNQVGIGLNSNEVEVYPTDSSEDSATYGGVAEVVVSKDEYILNHDNDTATVLPKHATRRLTVGDTVDMTQEI